MSEKNEEIEEEWDNNELCPCGSGKTYKNCCKKKAIKYYKKDEKEYIKSIPVDEQMKQIIKIYEERFKKIFGKSPRQDDYMVLGALENDVQNFTRKLKYYSEIPNDCIYAFDRTGIMVTKANKNKIPEIQIQEFEEAKKEYNNLFEQDIIDDKANMLQVAELTNMHIKEVWEENVKDIIYVLNRYIKQVQQSGGIKAGFIIKNRQDFFIYCVHKVLQNLKSLETLIEDGYIENSLAVVRFIYEILLNVIVYRKDEKLFNEKIIPLAGLDIGTFEKKNNDSRILVEKETKKEYYCGIKVSKLSQLSGKEYEILYDTLYNDLSGFIHIDTLAVKKVFAKTDNFLDVDECYTAGILALSFTLEIIGELNRFEETPKVLKEDFEYYINKTAEILLDSIGIIKQLDDKEIYDTIRKTLLSYKTN